MKLLSSLLAAAVTADNCCEQLKVERDGYPFPLYFKKYPSLINGRAAYTDTLGASPKTTNILYYDGDAADPDWVHDADVARFNFFKKRGLSDSGETCPNEVPQSKYYFNNGQNFYWSDQTGLSITCEAGDIPANQAAYPKHADCHSHYFVRKEETWTDAGGEGEIAIPEVVYRKIPNKIVNGYPVWQSEANPMFGIWFNGRFSQPAWVIGYLFYLNTPPMRPWQDLGDVYGWATLNEWAECPSDANMFIFHGTWTESSRTTIRPPTDDVCTLKGCEDTCTPDSTAPGEAVCSCPEGQKLANDDKTCEPIDETDKNCPSSDCWTWDSVNEECVLSDKCPTFLKCSPQMMDFRFNFDKYFGASTKDLNVQTSCPIQVNDPNLKMVDMGVEVDTSAADKMWRYPPASCDSTVTRVNEDGEDWIVVTKELRYGMPDDRSADIKGLESDLFITPPVTAKLSLCCKYKADFKAESDDIRVIDDSMVEGKMEQRGSWEGSFTVEYMDESFSNALPDDHVAFLGDMMRIQISWTVAGDPLADKLNWYVTRCTVKDLDDAGNEKTGAVDVIKDQCYAQVLTTRPVSNVIVSEAEYQFLFRSFSFNKRSGGKQKMICDVDFCLKDSECVPNTLAENINCPTGEESHDWKKGPNLLVLDHEEVKRN